MSYLKSTIILFIMFLSATAFAQRGTIRGTVIDAANGEPMFSVTVLIEGTTNGAVTDFDGKFEIKADPGIYNLQASFISYATIKITGVEVKPNEVTLIEQIQMSEDVEQLAEVVITAEAIRDTEEALQTVKRKSANVLDGISAASFRKIGDSDAGAAAKRITGVSIEGGKYVFVRGLGDRYSKTLLNGMDVPGLDPDKNALQIDLFPTNILNNITVAKSFTADLPADFTGGMVDIETKDIPDIKSFTIQGGLGYTPSMHFKDNYLTYNGSSTDFLGFDNGDRDIPFGDSELVDDNNNLVQRTDPNSFEGMRLASQLRSFDKQLSAMRDNSFMDVNLGFSLGNQFEVGKKTMGYSAAMTYRNQTRFYEDAVYGRAGLAGDPTVTELEQREFQQGDQGENEVLLGGMLGFSLKGDIAKYRLNAMRLQNGEKRTAIFGFVGQDEGSDFISYQHNLEYTERQMNNLLLSGEYFLNNSNWNIEWRLSPTLSKITEPDIRFTRYEIRGIQPDEVEDVSNIEELISREGTELSITTEGGFPERIWRDLEETNLSSRVDATKEYKFNEKEAKLKFGIRSTLKNRDYAIRRNQIFVDPTINLTGDPNELFLEENLWYNGQGNFLGNGSGNYFQADYAPRNPNSFESSIQNLAFYVSNEFTPFDKLKAVVGLRAENYVQNYTGGNQQGTIELNDEKVIDEFELYPTVNLIYALNENQNLRLSYSRTTARFSFKEASFAEIFDPLTGRTFIGSLAPIEDGSRTLWDGNIRSSLIDNYDLRWEVFQRRGQLISFSGFYKQFSDAIELVQLSTADNNFQVQNVGDAQVIGGEVELRQSLGLISSNLENVTFSGNFSLIHSQIEMSEAEFLTRVENQRIGDEIDRERDFQGQAPYILNVGFGYAGIQNGLEAGIYYNIQGPTLSVTGAADKPDVYTVPFHSLNFNVNKSFGEDERIRLGFKISNILDDKREREFQSFQSSDRLFESLSPGRRFSLSLNYRVF